MVEPELISVGSWVLLTGDQAGQSIAVDISGGGHLVQSAPVGGVVQGAVAAPGDGQTLGFGRDAVDQGELAVLTAFVVAVVVDGVEGGTVLRVGEEVIDASLVQAAAVGDLEVGPARFVRAVSCG